jgi:transcriptional regulator with XRE-family HTH domain
MPEFTNDLFRDAVAELMEGRGWSQRDLSAAVGVDPAHISRLLRRGSQLRVTPRLLARVAGALDVRPEYFSEYREWRVVEAVRTDPTLRERLYAGVVLASSGSLELSGLAS